MGSERTVNDFVQYLAKHIDASAKLQKEIAREMGYENPNVLSMIKKGLTRLPLSKVAAAARALEIDAGDLLRRWFVQYEPEAWTVIEECGGRRAA